MGGDGNFQNFSIWGVLINWSGRKKFGNTVIDPPTFREGRVRVWTFKAKRDTQKWNTNVFLFVKEVAP